MNNHASSSSTNLQGLSLGLGMEGWLTLGRGEPEQEQPAERFFTCGFCPRTFSTSQALGGHQHTHRRERDALKRGSEARVMNMPTQSSNPFTMVPPSHGPMLNQGSQLEIGLGPGPIIAAIPLSVIPPPLPPCEYPNYLEKRLGIRNNNNMMRDMDVGVVEGEDDNSSENTITCIELRNMYGHANVANEESAESGTEATSKELDLTLRL